MAGPEAGGVGASSFKAVTFRHSDEHLECWPWDVRVSGDRISYLKFSGGEAFCPVGGGSCTYVLNCDYSYAFGFPLPLLGMLAYGSVALLSFQRSGKKLLSGLGQSDARFFFLVITTSMATASAYFLYILSAKFAGTTCSYCLPSAILSFSLFFITLKDIGLEEIRNGLGLQLAVAGVVVIAFANTYNMADTQSPSLSDITLEPYETEITNQSSPLAVSCSAQTLLRCKNVWGILVFSLY